MEQKEFKEQVPPLRSPLKVSVLMLTYNQERYVAQAIRSVLAQQTDFAFELVIGNDASTDRTGEICARLAADCPDRIVLIDRPQNVGLAQNFVDTYHHLRGQYVAICEGDDYWLSRHKLQRQVAWLDAHPDYAICFHRVVNYYEENRTKSLSNGGQQRDTDILDLARGNYITNVSALFRRGVFGALPDWFAQVSTYDYPLHLLTAQYGRIHYMRRPMAVYRQRAHAIWSQAAAAKKRDISLSVRQQLMTYFRERRPDVCALLQQSCEQIRKNYAPDRVHAKPSFTKRVRRALSAIRAAVSRLVPVRGI
ncbi:MAG: glycosyltransferase [Prevotellaceae bacterium]|jgi:glycosyltransferase involved in cell wall biosynthesis|nr:glycosyltransferase [Prevotellaceae bacterium]